MNPGHPDRSHDTSHWRINADPDTGSARILPLHSHSTIPKEPNIGWYLTPNRYFTFKDEDSITFFINVLRTNCYQDPNLRWYSLSLLSRIKNLDKYVDEEITKIFVKILESDNLPRARAYAAAILGNLYNNDSYILEALQKATREDDDDSVRKVAKKSLNLLF